jgi:hypothetical protein
MLWAGIAGLTALAASAPAATAGGATRLCAPVLTPYPNTRYEDSDLRQIRATGVSCRVARIVARQAHRRALAMTPGPSPIRRFTWVDWRVTGDLRGDADRYVATRRGTRVTWYFT